MKARNGDEHPPSNVDKWRYTLWSTAVFVAVSHPETYKLMNKFFKVASDAGCPTIQGMLIHALVFTLIVRGIMEIKNL